MKKQLFTLFCCICILLTSIPFHTFAAEPTIYQLGEHVTGRLSADGTLTVSGSGSMYSYEDSGENVSPFAGNTSIQKVIVTEGVTSVGEDVFYNCSSLRTVEIADSVTVIEGSAFCRDLALRSVTMGDGVQEIKIFAFAHCIALETVRLSNGLKRLDYGAFYGCHSLAGIQLPEQLECLGVDSFGGCDMIEELFIPASVTSIGAGVFGVCPNVMAGREYKLKNVNVSSDNAVYKSENGVVYSKDGKQLIWYPEGRKDSSYSVKDGTKVIGAYGFCNHFIQRVVLPKTIIKISDYAFSEAYNLEDINLPLYLREVGEFTFASCRKLKRLVLPKSVTYIGKRAFSNCLALTDIYIYNSKVSLPSVATNSETVSDYLFVGCPDNLKVHIHKDSTIDRYMKHYEGGQKVYDLPQVDISQYAVQGIKNDYAYTGRPVCPNVSVKSLDEGTDYTVAIRDNVTIGTATVTIIGKGDYTGNITKTFKISQRAGEAYSLSGFDTYHYKMKEAVKRSTDSSLLYHASQPKVDNFIDYQKHLNLAYVTKGNKVHIKRLDCHYEELSEITLEPAMDVFGAVTCDEKGYYYVISAARELAQDAYSADVMALTKYDYNGRKVLEKIYSASETCPYWWLSGDKRNPWMTRIPFHAGSCDVAVSDNGILACNYGREMFNGHQSNFIFHVSTDTLELLNRGDRPYTSHSFNQRVIALSDGTFLSADHGDALSRAFTMAISGNSSGYYQQIGREYEAFHFREGANRISGYNETFAQMGSIVEVPGGAAFCAASEKTFSCTAAPSEVYCGHNEARNAFVQIYEIDDGSFGTVGGTNRILSDSVTGQENTSLHLTGDEKDTGVIWLTDYTSAYYAANCRMVKAGDYLVVLWEKLKYASPTKNVQTYYAVLDIDGTVLETDKKLGNFPLPENYDVITDGHSIFFAATDGSVNMKLYAIPIAIAKLGNTAGTATGHYLVKDAAVKATCMTKGKTEGLHCADCGKILRAQQETTDLKNHVGGTEIKDKKAASYTEKGYTGDTYCMGCHALIKKGADIPVLIKAKSISGCVISISAYTCIGKAIKPTKEIVVKMNGKTLAYGRDYKVTKYANNTNPGTASVTITGIGSYAGSKTATFKINLATPDGVKQSARTTSSIKLSWKKVTGATSYVVYRAPYGSKKFKKIATVKGTSYTNKKLTAGQYYLYRVRAYRSKSASAYSKTVTAHTSLSAPFISRVTSPKKKQAVVTWKKTKGATGYQVYRATSKKGKYKKVATVKSAKYTDKKVSRKKTYYYKVRAYRKVKGKTVYSGYSKVKGTKVK